MFLVNHHRFLGLLAAILLVPAALFGQSGWFAFTLPWDDDSPTFLDASDLLLDFPGQDPALVIELQKDYARQLLTHRNFYTGKTYAEDPAVLFVEIANEDSLFGNLLNEGGLNFLPGSAGCLPQRYSLELDTLWNAWLAARYPSGQALQAAWSAREAGFDPSDRMRNGSFENGMGEWTVQQIGSARASAAVETGAGPDGSAALRVELTSDGTDWHVQAFQNGHAIEKDRTYEFSFYARAAQSGTIRVDIMKGAPPWQNYGLSQSFSLATSWQRFTARGNRHLQQSGNHLGPRQHRGDFCPVARQRGAGRHRF